MQADTGITPSALLNKPTIGEHLRFAWAIFNELSRTRLRGAGVEAIQASEFTAIAQIANIPRTDWSDLWQAVRLIDEEWLRLVLERQKKERERIEREAKTRNRNRR